MKGQPRRRHALLVLAVTLIVALTVTSAEELVASNDNEAIAGPSAPMGLRMESRDGQDNGLDLNAVEGKSSAKNKNNNRPTSKVAVVYSEREPAARVAETTRSSTKGEEDEEGIKKRKRTSEEGKKNWRIVDASAPGLTSAEAGGGGGGGDSYLNALDHSRTSKDPREGVVRVDPRRKMSKPTIRREYREGPVYRPSAGDQYGVPKEPSSTYGVGSVDYGNDNHATNKFARISYGGPTATSPAGDSFVSSPSDAYSLPVQSSVNFNDNRYGPPVHRQVSYGGGYGAPFPRPTETSHGYGPPQPPENSYGAAPSNIYPASGAHHQAYKPPSAAYGAPYAIQDYSQHLPSLPNIGFSWPIALKLNAFTLAKILLKLVLFKMIVKFIAVICLLLFIPKLEIIKKGDKDDEDEGRGLVASDSALERLNALTVLITRSIEKYEKETAENKPNEECTHIGCRLRKFITFDQSWNDYGRLFESYVAEETSNDAAKNTLVTNHLDA